MAEETLPPVDSLSEEQFEEQFEKMMNTPQEEEEPSGETEEVVSEEPDTEIVEQPQDEIESETETLDEETTEEEEEEPTEDSTTEISSEEEDESKGEEPVGFQYENMPMDEALPFEIKANGMMLKATPNELIAGFQKSMNYTKNMQQIAPFRRSIGIMEDNGLSEADLNMMVELKAGNKEAIAKMLADAKLDPLDIETEGKEGYTPDDYGKEVVSVEMEQVKADINADTANADSMSRAINTMPDDFYAVIESDANALGNLHKDVASGVYQTIMPEVMKQQTLYGTGGKTTMEMYVAVARALSTQPKDVVETVTKKAEPSKESRKRASSGTKEKAPSKAPMSKSIDDMDDDEFAKDFEKIMGRSVDSFN